MTVIYNQGTSHQTYIDMFKRVSIGQVDPAQNGSWVNVLQALSCRRENDVYTECDFRVNDRILFALLFVSWTVNYF